MGKIRSPLCARTTVRIASAVRGLLICLLAVSVTGGVPVVTMNLHDRPKCGETCPRCLCRQHSLPAGLRAPCPCCSSREGGQNGISPLPPAVLPDLTRADAPLPPSELAWGNERFRCAFAPAVPHPPPRVLLST